MNKNPYLEYVIDEASGIEFSDARYQVWDEGYQVGQADGPAIKSVIRLQNDIVMVFDNESEQIPKYQGSYENVKKRILRDASQETIFKNWFGRDPNPVIVSKDNW